MAVTPVRFQNRFGRRYISRKELEDYAVKDLKISSFSLGEYLFDFWGKEQLLSPVAQINFPAPITRKFARLSGTQTRGKLEPDSTRWNEAIQFRNKIELTRWNNAMIYGESIHPFDNPSILQTEFLYVGSRPKPPGKTRVVVNKVGNHRVLSREDITPSYYHGWQVFWIECLLRHTIVLHASRTTDRDIHDWSMLPRNQSYLVARADLASLESFKRHFEAVYLYEDYRRNALSALTRGESPGPLPRNKQRIWRKRHREIGLESLKKTNLGEPELLEFLRAQIRWWDRAGAQETRLFREERERHIASTIALIKLAFKRDFEYVNDKVGRITSHFQPVLDVIFPNWTMDQRDLVNRSLKAWSNEGVFAELARRLDLSDSRIEAFCKWIESNDLHQFYLHFQRLGDIGRAEVRVEQAISSGETAALADLVESAANCALEERGEQVRGKTLGPKLKVLFGSDSKINLESELNRFGKLTRTGNSSLRRRLAQISRIKNVPEPEMTKVILSAIVIRNESAHMGLRRYGMEDHIDLVRFVSMAIWIIWSARS